VDRLAAEYDIQTRHVQFPLHPDTPREGLTLEQLFAGRDIDIPAAQSRMRQLMTAEGLAYGERTMTYNSRLAQELAKWADTHHGGSAIHDALFRGYFVDGLNIARVENLLAIAEQVGLDGQQALEVLQQRSMGAAVDADWQRSHDLGITDVPMFVVGNQGIVGAQPYEALEKLIIDAGAKPCANGEGVP
jgi:predicted DsbA family dithiol-disulfide isomerase